MPKDGVEALVDFLKDFEAKHSYFFVSLVMKPLRFGEVFLLVCV